MTANDRESLLRWYRVHRRDLPWRQNRDPYRIWISETMLQQTTTTAVLGYYDRFLQKFPTLSDLARATIEEVNELWAGLGYYSRARNLHRAAKMLNELKEFPRSYLELQQFPGFGPYTSRAVSSLAFSESVGVLDGNVIRLISRRKNLAVEWWRPQVRETLQKQIDNFVENGPSHELNQALMELGSQICTPKNPTCLLCPWLKSCRARKAKTVPLRPLKKIRRTTEIWIWSPEIRFSENHILLEKNNYAPFLRGGWLLPGSAKRVKVRPQRYDFRHSITHHDIFVQVKQKGVKLTPLSLMKTQKANLTRRWVSLSDVERHIPASLVRKAILHAKHVQEKKSSH